MSVTERIAVLEKKTISLSLLTEAMKTATEEEKKEWVTVCQSIVNIYAEPKKAGRPKTKTEGKKSEGPVEWNKEVHDVLISLAEDAGVMYDEFFEGVDKDDEEAVENAEKAFKAAAKAKGVNRKIAMTEAKVRKAEREGTSVEEKDAKREAAKARKAEKKAAKSGSSSDSSEPKKAKKPKKSKKVEAEAEPEAEEDFESMLESMNMEVKIIDGTKYFISRESGEALSEVNGEMGDHAGVYNWNTKVLDKTA